MSTLFTVTFNDGITVGNIDIRLLAQKQQKKRWWFRRRVKPAPQKAARTAIPRLNVTLVSLATSRHLVGEMSTTQRRVRLQHRQSHVASNIVHGYASRDGVGFTGAFCSIVEDHQHAGARQEKRHGERGEE